MKNLINFIVGDWSGEGHDKTASIVVSCSLTAIEIIKVCETSIFREFLDIRKICEEYEDNTIPKDVVTKLVESNIVDKDFFETNYKDEYTIYYDKWVELQLRIIKYLEPDFEYELVKMDEVHCGGYGLFYC